MRPISIILVSSLCGAALGSVAAVVAYNVGEEIPYQVASGGTLNVPSVAKGPAPRAEVPEVTHNFGHMRAHEAGEHEFVVKNTGDAPLTLKVVSTSCQCTLGMATDKPVLPKESTTVKMEWHAEGGPGRFVQTAKLLTNDPLKSEIILTIEGRISEGVLVDPETFHFDRISFGTEKSAEVSVLSYLEDTLQLEKGGFVPSDHSEFFDVRIEPLAKEDFPDGQAKAGARVTVTAKPGLPIGALANRLTLRTNVPDAETVEIPLSGRVVGEIRVHGSDFEEERGILRLGNVKSSEGKISKLNVVVRGEDAGDVRLEVATVDPPELRVTIGESRAPNDTFASIPVEVAIPTGTPPMVRLGTAQGREGRITLKTTHRSVHEISIGVRFTVER
jgi:hypothetical protein